MHNFFYVYNDFTLKPAVNIQVEWDSGVLNTVRAQLSAFGTQDRFDKTLGLERLTDGDNSLTSG
jgi:hypothetical protein